MSSTALKRNSRGADGFAGCGPGSGDDCHGPLSGRSKRRAARFEVRPADIIAILHHRLAVGDDHLILMQLERHYVAVDRAAEIIADVFGSPLFTGHCDGIRVRFTIIENDSVDGVVDAVRADGHGVALAARVEDTGGGGPVRTAIVRKWRPHSGASEGACGPHHAEELRGFASTLAAMLEDLYPDMRAIAVRTVRRWLEAMLQEQRELGDAGLWAPAWRESLTPFHLLTDMAAAMAVLTEDHQQEAIAMVRRFSELLPQWPALSASEKNQAIAASCKVPSLRLSAGLNETLRVDIKEIN